MARSDPNGRANPAQTAELPEGRAVRRPGCQTAGLWGGRAADRAAEGLVRRGRAAAEGRVPRDGGRGRTTGLLRHLLAVPPHCACRVRARRLPRPPPAGARLRRCCACRVVPATWWSSSAALCCACRKLAVEASFRNSAASLGRGRHAVRPRLTRHLAGGAGCGPPEAWPAASRRTAHLVFWWWPLACRLSRAPCSVCRLPSAVCRLPSAVCRLPSAVCRLPPAGERLLSGG